MSPREVDAEYAQDAHAFALLGAGILVWSMDEPGAAVRPAKGFSNHPSAPVVWRGWMLDSSRYQDWIAALGARPALFALGQYEMHHRMRNWVPAVQDNTPLTWFVESLHEVQDFMFPCHVKDGVKSANAKHLPRPCRSVSDVALHEKALIVQRGQLDDGLVLRKHMDASATEIRVWVMGPDPSQMHYHIAPSSPIPTKEWLAQVLNRASPSFFDAPFTMDIALEGNGNLFVMDMGDAGVSDYKEGAESPEFLAKLRQAWYGAWCRAAAKTETPV